MSSSVQALDFRMWSFGFRIWGSGFRVQDLGFMLSGSGFGVQVQAMFCGKCNRTHCARVDPLPVGRVSPIAWRHHAREISVHKSACDGSGAVRRLQHLETPRATHGVAVGAIELADHAVTNRKNPRRAGATAEQMHEQRHIRRLVVASLCGGDGWW